MKISGIFAVVSILAALLGLPAAEAAQGRTQVNNYETPCDYRERTARGIPAYSVHPGRGLMAYVDAHLDGSTPDAQLADFWAALDECDRTDPVPRWSWDQMILTGVEYLG